MNKFNPGAMVLVKSTFGEWKVDYFSHYREDRALKYSCVGGIYSECIPYKGNESLLGTDKDIEPKWTPKPNELVAVSIDGNIWLMAIFNKIDEQDPSTFICDTGGMNKSWNFCEPFNKHFSYTNVNISD